MKKKTLFIAIACITLGLLMMIGGMAKAQNANEFTVPLSDPAKRGRLKAHINYGSITIKGTARKDVLVRYTTEEDGESAHKGRSHDKGDNSKDGLRKISGGSLGLEVVENDNFVKVQSNSWNTKIKLEIEVPSGFDVEAHTYNDGDLVLSNLAGELELTNYNGEITALNISGSVVATTYNGEIKVTFDKVKDGTPMSYSTYNGDVDVTFPSTLKASFKMKTDQGDIYSGFDIDMKATSPVQKKDTQPGVYKVVVDDWKRGDVNGGGPEITIRNYNGDIFLRKK